MKDSIERVIASITEDRRASYPFDTKDAAKKLGIHPNKFGDWWRRTEEKLIELAAHQPAETGAALAVVMARGAAERQKRKL